MSLRTAMAPSSRRLTRGLTDLRLSEFREGSDHAEAVEQMERLEQATMFLNVGMVPQLKIEVLSSGSLDMVWLTMGLAALFTLIASCVTLGTLGRDSNNGGETQVSIVCLAGAVHVLTAAIILFVAVAYPQRILRKLFESGESKPLPEQLLVVFVVLFLLGNPTTSFWGAGWFWVSTRKALEEGSEATNFLLRKLSFEDPRILRVLSLVSAIMSYLCIAVFAVLAELTRVVLRSAETSFTAMDAVKDPASTSSTAQTEHAGGAGGPVGVKTSSAEPAGGASEPAAAVAEKRSKSTGPRRLSTEPSESFSDIDVSFSPFGLENVVHKMRQFMEKQLWDERGYKELLYFSKLGVVNLVLALTLVIFNSIYATRWDVIPNVVPLMGIITVLRVCTMEGAPCADDLIFQRALGEGVIFLLELGLLLSYGRLLTRAKRALWRVPYSVTRPQQVSFLFYALQSVALCALIGFLGILVVSVANVDFWVYRPTRTAEGEYVLVRDPLYQVGLSGASISIYYYGFFLVVNAALMAMAYLPADSEGVRGCFCPLSRQLEKKDSHELRHFRSQCSSADMDVQDSLARLSALGKAHDPTTKLSERRKEAALMFFRERLVVRRNLRLEDQERPVYIMSEEGARKIQHVVPLLALTRLGKEVGNAASRRLRNLEVSESWRDLASMARAEIVGEPSIVTTLRDLNVMILESEILAFNFTVVTYFLGRKRGAKTREEEAVLIESSAFTFEEHIIDDNTDTHCLIASSDDRVFVAFRGTVTETNARTDLAMQLVPWDLANDPDLVNDLQNAQESVFAQRGLTAHVHRGFLEAYNRVRGQILEHINRLTVDEYGNQIRAVFCTGHSLGAGLATLCAFDLGALLRKRTGRIDVAIASTTFGSPRCGNLVFQSRYNLLVPKTNRFVNAGDIIPKGPPRNVLRKLTLTGYRHVGRQILMDSNGRFIISPSRLERFLQHGNLFYGNKPKAHTTMRYAYSLLLWCIMAHYHVFDPDLWHIHMETIDSIGRARKQYMNPVVLERYNEVIRNKGFRYRVGRREVRDMGVQADSDLEAGLEETGFEVVGDKDQAPSTGSQAQKSAVAGGLLDHFRQLVDAHPNDSAIRSVLDHMHEVIDRLECSSMPEEHAGGVDDDDEELTDIDEDDEEKTEDPGKEMGLGVTIKNRDSERTGNVESSSPCSPRDDDALHLDIT